MTPLCITAQLRGPVSMSRPIALDSLLAWALVQRLNVAPDEHVEITIPVEMEPGRRFHLCSHSIGDVEEMDMRHINRRPIVEQAQMLAADNVRTINTVNGPSKGRRFPTEVAFMRGDVLRWYCIGDAPEICELLRGITHVGGRRSVGVGAVISWSVDECETWEGFPVARDGVALRPLPSDTPDVSGELEMGRLTFPYHSGEPSLVMRAVG